VDGLVTGELPPPAVDIRELTKSFPGTLALDRFDLELRPGDVHALLGGNGSGKSTLIKVLSGFHVPDGGEVLIAGQPMTFGSGDHAYRLGCRFVHQDLGLIEMMSVSDNLHMGRFPTRAATISARSMRATARVMLHQVGLDLDPAAEISVLGAAERTGVALARALRADEAHPPRLLVLDEPTATLPVDEVERLLDMIRAAASNGVAVLFVTHHLEEAMRIANSVTVLRDGQIVGRNTVDNLRKADLVELLAGGDIEVLRSAEQLEPTGAAPSLIVEDLRSGPLRSISFTALAGEIVGIAGLTGSGREAVMPAIFGALPHEAGTVTIAGKPIPANRPDRAMAAGAGLLPADRKRHSGIMTLSAKENLSLSSLRPFWSKLWLHKREEVREALSWFAKLSIRPEDAIDLELIRFSGGNQQRILFAKWLRRHPSVLLLDEPTQGVDIGAKAELHRQVIAAAKAGTAVVIGSTDTEELAGICARILVLRHGQVAAELVGEDVTVSRITASVVSDAADAPSTRRTA
jgi:ribose transport system ATP-binding protein